MGGNLAPELKRLLRDGHGDDEIGRAIGAVWRGRTDRYSEIRTGHTPRPSKIEMSYIGG